MFLHMLSVGVVGAIPGPGLEVIHQDITGEDLLGEMKSFSIIFFYVMNS